MVALCCADGCVRCAAVTVTRAPPAAPALALQPLPAIHLLHEDPPGNPSPSDPCVCVALESRVQRGLTYTLRVRSCRGLELPRGLGLPAAGGRRAVAVEVQRAGAPRAQGVREG